MPDEERSEPSPAEVARLISRVVIFRQDFTSDEAWERAAEAEAKHKILPVLENWRARLAEATERAAKREALLSVAKALCEYCARGCPVDPALRRSRGHMYVYSTGTTYPVCRAPREVHDALSALESSGEAKP